MTQHSMHLAAATPGLNDDSPSHPCWRPENANRHSIVPVRPTRCGWAGAKPGQAIKSCQVFGHHGDGRIAWVWKVFVDGLSFGSGIPDSRLKGAVIMTKASSLCRILVVGLGLACGVASAHGAAAGYRIAATALDAFLGRLGQNAADSMVDTMVGREAIGLHVPVWIASWNHRQVACDISAAVPLEGISKSAEWSRRIDRTERYRVMFISAVPRVIEEATVWSGSRYETKTAPLLPRVRSLKKYCRYPQSLRIEESSYTLGAQAVLPEGFSRRVKASQAWRVAVMSMRSQLHEDCQTGDSPRAPISRVVAVRSWSPTFFRLENNSVPTMGSEGVVTLRPTPTIHADHLGVPGVVGNAALSEPFPWEDYNRERAAIIHGGRRYPFPILGSAPPGASFVPPFMSMEASLAELERRFNFEGQYHGEYQRVMEVAHPFEMVDDTSLRSRPVVVPDASGADVSE